MREPQRDNRPDRLAIRIAADAAPHDGRRRERVSETIVPSTKAASQGSLGEPSQGRRPCQSVSANDASDASFRAFDCDAEVVALALDRVHLAVEFADPHDAVEERGVAVVVEDQVTVGPPVADVYGGGIVPFGRTLERQLAGKRSGLLDVVVVAEGERPRQLSDEIARRSVVVQPSSELRVAEGDPDWRALRGVGVLVAGGRARTRRRIRGARSGSAGGLVTVLVSPTASRERDGR